MWEPQLVARNWETLPDGTIPKWVSRILSHTAICVEYISYGTADVLWIFPLERHVLWICSQKPSFFADSSIFTGPRKPTISPTAGRTQGAHLHRHCHQALKVSSCGGHLYHGHGKKGYGHVTMMGNPSDDCINPYKWIQMVVE